MMMATGNMATLGEERDEWGDCNSDGDSVTIVGFWLDVAAGLEVEATAKTRCRRWWRGRVEAILEDLTIFEQKHSNELKTTTRTTKMTQQSKRWERESTEWVKMMIRAEENSAVKVRGKATVQCFVEERD
jgi:hypothetical protein